VLYSKTQPNACVPPIVRPCRPADLDQYGRLARISQNMALFCCHASPHPTCDLSRDAGSGLTGWNCLGRGTSVGFAPITTVTWIMTIWLAWCRRPDHQYWSSGGRTSQVYAGHVGWAPLCPCEDPLSPPRSDWVLGNTKGPPFSSVGPPATTRALLATDVGRPLEHYYATTGASDHFGHRRPPRLSGLHERHDLAPALHARSVGNWTCARCSQTAPPAPWGASGRRPATSPLIQGLDEPTVVRLRGGKPTANAAPPLGDKVLREQLPRRGPQAFLDWRFQGQGYNICGHRQPLPEP